MKNTFDDVHVALVLVKELLSVIGQLNFVVPQFALFVKLNVSPLCSDR